MIELRKFIRDEEGQDLVEYALLLVFLGFGCHLDPPHVGKQRQQGIQPVQ